MPSSTDIMRLNLLICIAILLHIGLGSPFDPRQRWSPQSSTTQISSREETRVTILQRQHMMHTLRAGGDNRPPQNLKPYAYMGVPARRYFLRATRVHQGRVKKWALGIGEYFRCRLRGQRCSLGFICVGPLSQKQCRRPVPKGGVCDGLYLSCDGDHECQFGRCKITAQRLEKCTLDSLFKGYWNFRFPFCSRQLYCDPRALICRSKRREFKFCNKNVFVCRKGLVCDRGQCRSKIGVGSTKECRAEFGDCKWGLICAVTYPKDSKWRCLRTKHMPLTCSGRCPFAGYDCINGICWRRLGRGESCVGARFAFCKRGLICKRSTNVVGWRCVKRVEDNDYKCMFNSDCVSGMYCHETLHECVQQGEENEKCSRFYLCRSGLVCKSGKCRKQSRVGRNKVCGWEHGKCRGGLVCAVANKTDILPRCLKKEDVPITCELGCPEGYLCWDNVCWRLLQRWESCMTRKHSICKKGLSCSWRFGWRCTDDF